MKILLVNPPDKNTISEAPSKDGKSFLEPEDFGTFPPLGLLYIAAYLEKHAPEHEIQVIDCVGEKCSHADLSDKIAAFGPDVVGVTSFTVSLIDVLMVAETAKRPIGTKAPSSLRSKMFEHARPKGRRIKY